MKDLDVKIKGLLDQIGLNANAAAELLTMAAELFEKKRTAAP
ncbi:MAG: hypothetical protein WC965_06945 [Thiohalomonadaceae bacterium]|jgi:hypothetical protein